MKELKPCPFCGGEAELVGYVPQVVCSKCHMGSMVAYSDSKRAIAEWNVRIDDARVAQLETALGNILHETMTRDYEGNFGAIRKMASDALAGRGKDGEE